MTNNKGYKDYFTRLEELDEKAKKLGMNLNYTPEVYCPDIEAISNAEWLELRKNGIGGSDSGAVCGVNEHRNTIDVALDKLGQVPKKEKDAETQYTLDFGHALEPLILKLYAEKTGLGMFEENKKKGLFYGVYTDRAMYRHPLHPFMLGDMDGVAVTQEGEKIGLEFKTYNYQFKSKWESGIYGQGGRVKNPEYVYQVRHYMAVANLTRFDLVAICSNNAADMTVVTFYRDLEQEKLLIEEEERFWNDYIAKGIIPTDVELNQERLDAIMHEFGKKYDPQVEPIVLPEHLKDNLDKIQALKEEKAELNARIKDIDEKQIPILKQDVCLKMGSAGEAILKFTDNGMNWEYVVSNKPICRETFDKKKLKILDPLLYEECVKKDDPEDKNPEDRTFKLSKKLSKNY